MSTSDLAISVRGISKAYTITHNAEKHDTLAETLWHRLKDPLRRSEQETFWALKDVSFDVKKGEVVGIIGRNGAGKSTLLKIMSRITEPTSGEIDLYGRIGSLLEVGTGFHPELSGRENIYLNGQILGMRRREIDAHFDAIVDFAGVETFIDTAVKRYSSGMYVRLAFAVAAHLNPEILIIDEVLSVGDAEFQKKCLGKIRDVATGGRTVLFVSHDMTNILKLCSTAILLKNGNIAQKGSPKQVVQSYLSMVPDTARTILLDHQSRKRHAPDRVELISATSGAANAWQIEFGQEISFEIAVRSYIDLPCVEIGPSIFTATGFEIASTLSSHVISSSHWQSGTYTFTVGYKNLRLLPGRYCVGLGIRTGYALEDYLSEAFHFEIVASELSAKLNAQTFAGALVPDVSYDVSHVSPAK